MSDASPTPQQRRVPIVSIVGKKHSGKTTLVVKLVAELKRRGWRVATAKHDAHSFEIDHEGKDSWRHAQAGADAVLISSPAKLALIKKTDSELPLDALAQRYLDDVDIILTDGFLRQGKPAIEVVRHALGVDLICPREQLFAIATDARLDLDKPQFDLNDAAGLADAIEHRFLGM